MANYKKRLQGVKATEGLRKLLGKAVDAAATVRNDEKENATSFTNDNNNAVLEACRPFSLGKAVTVLKEFKLEEDYIPIPVVKSMETVLKDDSEALQTALLSTSLVFTPPPLTGDELLLLDESNESSLTKEQRKFRQRMQRLRFKNEETKYSKLTSNLNMNVVQDDVTTKSMTYAASIGLNMIVAPISFGVFMYFFAGSLLDYFWPKSSLTNHPGLANQPDIKKVIAGVVSGVMMLFIEMLLFVIRTHEMDKAMRRKQKKNKNQSPFGYYSSATAKSYHPSEGHRR